MTHDGMIAVIKTHRDGGKIQFWSAEHHAWLDVVATPTFNFWKEVYRVKPESKPDVVKLYSAFVNCIVNSYELPEKPFNLRLTFDGESGALKLSEVV